MTNPVHSLDPAESGVFAFGGAGEVAEWLKALVC